MKYMINFLLAIILTSIAYFIGGVIFKTELTIFQSFMIGLSVVSLGAITEALHAPIGVIIFVPFPVGMFLLWLFLQKSLHIWFLTYLVTLVIYTILHMIMTDYSVY